jgi:Family of unknown function (DUF5670)
MFKSSLEPYRWDSLGVGPNQGAVMLAAIAAVLLVLWLLGFIAFHVTFGAIHLLLVIAVVLFVAHFLTGRSAAV